MTFTTADLNNLINGLYAKELQDFTLIYKDNRSIVLSLKTKSHQIPFTKLRKVLSGCKKLGSFIYTKTEYIDGVHYIHMSPQPLTENYDSRELIESIRKRKPKEACTDDVALGESRTDKPIRFKAIDNIYWECWGKPILVFRKGVIYDGIKHSDGSISAHSEQHRVSDFIPESHITILD